MSEAIMNRFIAEFLAKSTRKISDPLNYEFAKIAREYTDKSGAHYFKVSVDNIQSIIINGLARYVLPVIQAENRKERQKLSNELRIRNKGKKPEDREKLPKQERSVLLKLASEKAIADYVEDIKVFEQIFEVVKSKLPKSLKIKELPDGSLEVYSPDRRGGDIIKIEIFNAFKNSNLEKNPKLKAILNKEITIINKKTKKQEKLSLIDKISRETHFLHEGTTVGQSQAAILRDDPDKSSSEDYKQTVKVLDDAMAKVGYTQKNPFKTAESRNAAIELLRNAIDQVIGSSKITWQSIDGDTRRKIVVSDGGIRGFFDSREFNTAGSEMFDWKKLAPDIQNKFTSLLVEAAEKQTDLKSLANQEGSQPFSDRLLALVVNKALDKLIRDKKIKIKKIKQEKPKSNYKGKKINIGQNYKKRKKAVKPAKINISKASIKKSGSINISNQTKEPILNLNALKAQINARLSMTVIKNMGTPALENRTGRFARSVEVTDVIQTSKGFPSIGYTYQKYPYQTFEPGFKQGSAQRDPRTLIDRSIREIASELLIGRFYTRRV